MPGAGLSPLRGLGCVVRLPTACAVGCILAPLRGWVRGTGWCRQRLKPRVTGRKTNRSAEALRHPKAKSKSWRSKRCVIHLVWLRKIKGKRPLVPRLLAAFRFSLKFDLADAAGRTGVSAPTRATAKTKAKTKARSRARAAGGGARATGGKGLRGAGTGNVP